MDFTILHFAIHIVWRVNVICICRKPDITRKTTVAYPELRFEEPEKDWAKMFQEAMETPPEKHLLNQACLIREGAYFLIKQARIPIFRGLLAGNCVL